MNTPLSLFLAATLAAPERPEWPEPRPVVGDALPAGAVARLGPTAFRYSGYVNVLHLTGTPTVWHSPDGKRVAVTSGTGVHVWDAATGRRLVWVRSDESGRAAMLGFHPDGDIFVHCWRAWDDGGAGVFRLDPLTGKVKSRFQPKEPRYIGPVSADGKLVFSRTRVNDSVDENVANEVETGKEVWRRQMPGMGWFRVSPDGSRLVTWSAYALWSAEVLDAATGKTVQRFAHPTYTHTPSWTSGGLAVAPKAARLVSPHGWDRGFSVFEAGTEKPVHQQPGAWYDNAFFRKGGKEVVLLLKGRRAYHVEVWDVVARKKLSSAEADVYPVSMLAPDGTTLAVAGNRASPQALQFFDVATGKRVPPSPEPFTRAAVVWYQPDGTLASADEKLTTPVKWDVKTGAMTPLPAGTKPPAPLGMSETFRPPEGTSRVVAAPGGKRALGYRLDPEDLDSAPGDTYVGLFDATGRLVAKYQRWDHTGGAEFAFAPDGKTFAVARGDGTLTIFESQTGKELRVFRNAGGVSSMAYSPDGRFLATNFGDGPILVWDVKPEKK